MDSPSSMSIMQSAASVEDVVVERYTLAAKQPAGFCCPSTNDPKLPAAVRGEILDGDYGCGDPTRHVRPGETVIDLELGGNGIVTTILSVGRTRPSAVPQAVGLYITAAYWFTASTSFANPAVTIARALTDTFAGIQLANVPGFLIAQLVGGAIVVVVFGRLWVPSE